MRSSERLRVWLDTRHAVWITFLTALAVRATIAVLLPQRIIWFDGERYYTIAQNLLDGAGFGDLNMNRLAVPTLPLLIAGIESVVGRHNFLGLRLGMALVGALACLLGYRLATHWFGRRAGVIAGIALACIPFLAYTSALFEYPQTLFVTLMAGYFLLFRRFHVQSLARGPRWRGGMRRPRDADRAHAAALPAVLSAVRCACAAGRPGAQSGTRGGNCGRDRRPGRTATTRSITAPCSSMQQAA